MSDFYRLETPTYPGGMPGSHGWINNDPSVPGSRAPVDGAKTGHPTQDGTYFVAFEEDALSMHFNRANGALAVNTDWLDDVISGALPMPAELEVAGGGAPVTKVQLTGNIFVGRSGEYTDAQKWRDKLIKIVDPNTGNELLDSNNAPIACSAIWNSADASNVIGTEATGFHTNPWVYFSGAGIPTGQAYKLLFCKRGTLNEAVRSLTYLDMTNRLMLDGAPKVAGEVERFLHEASRRSSGALLALAAGVLETQGAGDNLGAESSSLLLDVDPLDNDPGTTGRSVTVRFGRDGSPLVALQVEEDGAAGAIRWLCEDDVVRLGDVNTLATADEHVALSSDVATDGDVGLRVLEKLPSVTGEPSSILKHLNARWCVTVGNGTTTFGDFNGASAIDNVITAWNAAPTQGGLHIKVKAGTYNISTAVTGGSWLTVEGLDSENCIIENTGSTSIVCSSARLTLRHLKFTENAGTELGLSATNCSVVIEDCNFDDQRISLSYTSGAAPATGVLTVKRSKFFLGVGVAAGSVVTLSWSLSPELDMKGFVFEDCAFSTLSLNAICRIVEDLSAPGEEIGGIVFSRCKIQVGGSTVTGTALDEDTGVLSLVANNAGYMHIKDVTYRDCEVDSSQGGGTESIALFLRTGDSGNYVTVGAFTISGGRWDFGSAGSTTITPFYIGGDQYNDRDVDEILIENVDIGFSGTSSVNYGQDDSRIGYVALHASNAYAACFLSARAITLRNVTWTTATWDSSNGEFMFYNHDVCWVGGLHINNWVNTAAFGPCQFRVLVEPSVGAGNPERYGSTLRLDINGLGRAETNDVVDAGHAVVKLVPFREISLEGCCISELDHTAVQIWGQWDPLANRACRFRNCQIREIEGYGVEFQKTNASHASLGRGTSFIGCELDSCNNGGLFLYETTTSTPVGFWELLIDSNQIHHCESAPGLIVAPGKWTMSSPDDLSSTVTVVGNIVSMNNGGAEAEQIQFGWGSSASGSNARATVVGNDCGIKNSTGAQGIINFTGMASPSGVVGVETGYNVPAAGSLPYTLVSTDKAYISTLPMFHNQAILTF